MKIKNRKCDSWQNGYELYIHIHDLSAINCWIEL